MATLTANITADATVLPVSAEIAIGDYTINSEAIHVYGTSRGPQGRAFDRLFVSVERGIGGTTKATHTSGTTLTRYYPGAPGGGVGGGVTVDNTVDAPFAATTLVAPGATESGPDEATLSLAVFSRKVTLTNAQIIGMRVTAVEVVPSPGVGKCIYPLGGVLAFRGSVAYTNIDAQARIKIRTGGYGLRSWQAEPLLTFGSDCVLPLTPANESAYDSGATTEGPDSVSEFADQALLVYASNAAAGDFTGGDAANELDVTVVYTVVEMS